MSKPAEEYVMSLRFLMENPGAWHLVAPKDDKEIVSYMRGGLIEWRGKGKGYHITEAGKELVRKAGVKP